MTVLVVKCWRKRVETAIVMRMTHDNGLMTESESAEMILGALVRLKRTERGWSQTELADRLRRTGAGWSGPLATQSTVARIEGATRPIRVNELYPLAEALGTTVDELLPGLAGPSYTPEAAAEALAKVQTRLELDGLKQQLEFVSRTLTAAVTMLDLMRTEGIRG